MSIDTFALYLLHLTGAKAPDMPTPGYYFRDSGTTPPAEEEGDTLRRRLTLGDQYQSIPNPQSPLAGNKPIQAKATDSHALAVADHEVKGAAQEAGKTGEVTDLGWRSPPKDIDTLVGKLPNEELWTLVRRFNKVRARVLTCSHVLKF
jgi:Protein of unknown function (DUF3292)